MKYFNLLVIAILSTFLACKTAKKVPVKTTTETTTAVTVTSILQKIADNGVDFERMNGDADVDYKSKQMNIGVSSNVRWRRDSLIWLNVKKMGFNVARAQLTRDSAFVVNYLQSNYVAKPISYVEKNFGVPLDFYRSKRPNFQA